MNKPNSQENGTLKSKNNELAIEEMIASFTLNLMEWLIPRLKCVTCRFLMEGTCYRNKARPLECHLVWTN